jgi:hypothetical protein
MTDTATAGCQAYPVACRAQCPSTLIVQGGPASVRDDVEPTE